MGIQHSMRTPEIIQEVEMKQKGLGLLVCNDLAVEADIADEGMVTADVAHTKGRKCKFMRPEFSLNSHKDGPDVFHLGTLLKVAGVDLDKSSPAQHNTTRRLHGTTVVLTVHYMNTRPWRDYFRAFFQE